MQAPASAEWIGYINPIDTTKKRARIIFEFKSLYEIESSHRKLKLSHCVHTFDHFRKGEYALLKFISAFIPRRSSSRKCATACRKL